MTRIVVTPAADISAPNDGGKKRVRFQGAAQYLFFGNNRLLFSQPPYSFKIERIVTLLVKPIEKKCHD